MKNLIFNLSIFLLLTSCFEKDEYIVPRELPYEEQNIPYSMYEFQTYYSISDQSIVSHHDYEDWDLGFESKKNGYHIILNYARFMYAGNTYKTDFQNIKSVSETSMDFDASTGNLDSTVLNDWVNLSNPENPVFNQYVYIIDRGKNESGDMYGYKKIVFERMENDTLYVHFANLDNTEEHRYKIPKDSTTNCTLLSLENGGGLKVSEPDKSSWDICFTKYSTKIPDDSGVLTDYLVRGVFLNRSKQIEVGTDTVHAFEDVLPEMVDDYEYSNARDAIGYDWKVFEENTYTIRKNKFYILRNVNGNNYKMRFTRFYNSEGEKGYPSFELMEL